MQLHRIFWSNLAVLKQDVSLHLSLSLSPSRKHNWDIWDCSVDLGRWFQDIKHDLPPYHFLEDLFGRLRPYFPCPHLKKSDNFSWWSSDFKLFTFLYYVIQVRLPNTKQWQFNRQPLSFSSIHWGDVVNHAEDAEAMRELLKDAEHGDQDSVPEAGSWTDGRMIWCFSPIENAEKGITICGWFPQIAVTRQK